MSYSGHAKPDRFTLARGPHPDTTTRVFSLWRWLSIWLVIVLWALFGVTAISSPSTLNEIWAWASGLSLAAQFVVWIVARPWMVGIAIFQADWPNLVRVLLIIGAAVISIWTFLPNNTS